MRHFFGIYGFEFTNEIPLNGIRLIPLTNSLDKAKKLATSDSEFNLTGIGEFTHNNIDEIPDSEFDKLFDLTGTLTFCQQQEVLLSHLTTKPNESETQQLFQSLPAQLDFRKNRYKKGTLLVPTNPEPKCHLLNLCLNKLGDDQFNKDTEFRGAFYRNVEIFRLNIQHVDITYYATFSALELLARRMLDDYDTSDIAMLITPFLKGLHFNVYEDKESGGERNIRTYARLRNALFHNGKFEKTFTNKKKQKITVTQSDDGYKLEKLLPDVLLRVLGYDDEYINWDRWIDRNAFKKY